MRAKNMSTASLFTLIFLLLVSQVTMGQSTEDRRLNWIKQSAIIFDGVVEATGKSSVKETPSTRHTVVFNVENIRLKPEAVTMPGSRRVTVIVRSPQSFEKGLDFTIYGNIQQLTNSGIVVKEIGHERTKDTPEFNNLRQLKEDLKLHEHIRQADLIAVGQVRHIRIPDQQRNRQQDTEHDPEWRDAIITLNQVLKNRLDAEMENIIVRYPSSMDIAWYDIPKLEESQKSIFILRKTTDETGSVGGSKVPLFFIQSPLDVLSEEDVSRVRNIMEEF